MKFKKTLLVNILIAFLAAILIHGLIGNEFFSRLELTSLDLFFKLRGALPNHPKINIIEIDDENIVKIGRWPWKRTWHAAIVKALSDLGAKTVYLDIILSEPSPDKNDDIVLGEAIKESGNVYLPLAFQENIPKKEMALLPIEDLSSGLKGTGFINVHPDKDGILRKIPLIFRANGKIYYHIALKIAMDYLDLTLDSIEPKYLVLSDANGKKIKIPFLKKNDMLIDWSGKWKDTFNHYSFLDVLNAYSDLLENKKPEINMENFKNSICLVGVTSIGLYDIKPTPLEPAYPSIGAIANVIDNILNERFIETIPSWGVIIFLYLLALIPAVLITGERSLREVLTILSIAVLAFIASFIFFREGLWINYSHPLFALAVSYVAISTYNFIKVSVEKKRFFKLAVTDELTRLFNIRYFKMILRAECLMAKADPDKHFCVIMADIDNFKMFNDTYGHQVGDLVLQEVSSAIKIPVRSSDVVARYGGEEIIVLLRGALLENGMQVAEKIRRSVESRVIKDEKNTYNVTISAGVSMYRPPADNADLIIKRADEGLYKAKENGRNRVSTVERSS